MPAGLIALIPSLKDLFKTVGKGLGGYAQSALKSLGDNAGILAGASACTTLFLLIMGTLNGGFGFPALLNIGIHGIYHLGNAGGVISNGKSVPTNISGNNASGSRVNIN